jgi:hypothetical protein
MKAKQIEISFSPFFLLLVLAVIFIAGMFLGRSSATVQIEMVDPPTVAEEPEQEEVVYHGYYGDRGIEPCQ